MFKKFMLSLAAIAMLGAMTMQPAEAYGGRGYHGGGYGFPLALGVLGGVALGAAIAGPHYYEPYPYYAPVYVAPPVYVQPYPGPAPVYVSPAPQPYCRGYTSTIIVNGQYQQSYGTACLQPDGSWQVVQ